MRHTLQLTLFLLLLIPTASTLAGQADVTAVTVSPEKDGSYQFTVTVLHKDEGWDHYADSWEIRDSDGTLYGTRTLHHPHVSEQPFTRSLSGVKIPADQNEVIVRAHDSVHLFGGKTVTVVIP
jgi:hypothetical protein